MTAASIINFTWCMYYRRDNRNPYSSRMGTRKGLSATEMHSRMHLEVFKYKLKVILMLSFSMT